MSKNDVSFLDFAFYNVVPIIVGLVFFRRSFAVGKAEDLLEAFVSFFAGFFRFVERFRAAAAEFVFRDGDGQAAAVSDFFSGTDFHVRISIVGEFEDAFATLSVVPHERHPVESDKDIFLLFSTTGMNFRRLKNFLFEKLAFYDKIYSQ